MNRLYALLTFFLLRAAPGGPFDEDDESLALALAQHAAAALDRAGIADDAKSDRDVVAAECRGIETFETCDRDGGAPVLVVTSVQGVAQAEMHQVGGGRLADRP